MWIRSAYQGEGYIVAQLLNITAISEDMKRKLRNIQRHREEERKQASHAIAHFLDVYAFAKRVGNVVNPALKELAELYTQNPTSYETDVHEIRTIMQSLECWLWDFQEDLLRNAILRAAYFYNLSVSDLSSGLTRGHQAAHPLPRQELVELLVKFLKEKSLTNAATRDWIASMQYSTPGDHGKSGSVTQLLFQLMEYTSVELQKVEFLEPLFRWLLENVFTNKKSRLYAPEFAHLCNRGQETNPNSSGYHQLQCYYLRPMGGWFRVKVEILNRLPLVYRFYEVIHPREMRKVREMSMHQLYVSEVAKILVSDGTSFNSDFGMDTLIRFSGSKWLPNNANPLMTRLSQRIQFITGMHATKDTYNVVNDDLSSKFDSEEFQTVGYGMVGLYDQHHDYFSSRWNSRYKDRMGTFIFYLSTPLLGGETGFSKLGISVKAIKGSAVMWYNMQPNGERVVASLHGGCPVLVGSKWIMNKWLNERGQMFTRPCHLNYSTQDFAQL